MPFSTLHEEKMKEISHKIFDFPLHFLYTFISSLRYYSLTH